MATTEQIIPFGKGENIFHDISENKQPSEEIGETIEIVSGNQPSKINLDGFIINGYITPDESEQEDFNSSIILRTDPYNGEYDLDYELEFTGGTGTGLKVKTTEVLSGEVIQVQIINSGSGYTINDQVTSTEKGVQLRVNDVNLSGAVTSVSILIKGSNFKSVWEYNVTFQERPRTETYWISTLTDPTNNVSKIGSIDKDDKSYLFFQAACDYTSDINIGYKIIDTFTPPVGYLNEIPQGLSIPELFDESITYNEDEYVSFLNKIYQCNTSVTGVYPPSSEWNYVQDDSGLGIILGTCSDSRLQLKTIIQVQAISYTFDGSYNIISTSTRNIYTGVNLTEESIEGLIPESGSVLGSIRTGEIIGEITDLKIGIMSNEPFSVTATGLPEGIRMDKSGILIGTPRTEGVYNIDVTINTSSTIYYGSYVLNVDIGLEETSSRVYLPIPRTNLSEIKSIKDTITNLLTDDDIYRKKDPSFGIQRIPKMHVSCATNVTTDMQEYITENFAKDNKSVNLKPVGYNIHESMNEDGEVINYVVTLNTKDEYAGFNYFIEEMNNNLSNKYYTPYFGEYPDDDTSKPNGTLKNEDGFFYLKTFLEYTVQGTRNPYDPNATFDFNEIYQSDTYDLNITSVVYEDIDNNNETTGERIVSYDYYLPNWSGDSFKTEFPLVYLSSKEAAENVKSELESNHPVESMIQIKVHSFEYNDYWILRGNNKKINF